MKFDFGSDKPIERRFGQATNPDAFTSSSIQPIFDLPQAEAKPSFIQGLLGGVKDYATNPKKLFSEIGKGLSAGISMTGTAKDNRRIAEALSSRPGPFQSFGKESLEKLKAQDEYLKANPTDTLPAMLGEQIPQIPLWITGQGAVRTAAKELSKLAPSLAAKTAKLPGIVKGGLTDAATYGGVVAPVESINKGDNFSQFLDREKQLPGVFLGGTLLRGAGKVASRGIEGTKSFLKPLGVPQAPIPQTTPITPSATPFRMPNEIPRTASIQQPLGGPLSRVQPTQNGGQPLPRAATTPEAMPRERQFAQNVRESQVAPGEVKSNLDRNQLTYEPITNKETLNKANSIVNEDAVKARELFDSPSKGISADDVALGESLIVKAIKDGDTAGANKLIADLAEKLTTAGQAVQAASIFKKLTPEGMLLYAQRVINSTNKDLVERLGTKAQKILLTSEDSQFIIDTMTAAQRLPDGRQKDIAMAQVMKLIADKVPATFSDKLKGLQRISLLLNPKTMGRNVLGNTIFGAVDNLSNVVATPIDKAVSRFTGARTTTLPSPLGQLKSGLRGARETIEDAKLGVDTYSAKTQYELPSGRTFDSKTLDRLDRATKVGLQLGDRPFYNAAYDDVLRQQMKLAKVDKPSQMMIDQAHRTAQQRTYQDVNTLTNAFKMFQSALNGGKEIGLGNIVLPFVKTPANILKRVVEYSPVGLERAFKEARQIGKGKFDQKAFVDSISRSVTGTAIIMVGYDLAKRGIITGSGNKDKDVAAFERGLGKSDFAFKVDDKFYTYDWAQPISMAMAVGADIYLKGKDRKEAENVVVDAVKSGGETLFKQSLLQGLQRFMGGYSPIDNLAETAINAPTQLIPTLSNQIGQLTDSTQRTSYDPTNLGTGKNLLKARIPGLNRTLEPKVNTSGEILQRNQGKNNLFNVFLNPGSSTSFKPNEVQKEILRVYESTGDKGIFPKLAPKSLTDKGKSIQLTPKEITTFQKTLGKTTESRIKSIIDYKEPGTFTQQERDERKAKEFKEAIDKAYEDAKKEFLQNRGKK